MNIAIRHGRGFDESDRGRGVAVLSEKAAQLLWPGDPNPVGRRFIGEDDKPKTLVGVVAEVRAVLHNDPPPTAYYPYWQRVPGDGALVVRTTADPRSVAGALRSALRSEDAQLPIREIRTMEDVLDLSVAQRRFQLTLMLIFAASALLVASLGIYGVVSYSVARRRNEIGIRMALGARRSQLLALVIRQGMTPVDCWSCRWRGRCPFAGPDDSRLVFRGSADGPSYDCRGNFGAPHYRCLSLPDPGSPGGKQGSHRSTSLRIAISCQGCGVPGLVSLHWLIFGLAWKHWRAFRHRLGRSRYFRALSPVRPTMRLLLAQCHKEVACPPILVLSMKMPVKRAVGVLLGALIGLGGWAAHAQPSLTPPSPTQE